MPKTRTWCQQVLYSICFQFFQYICSGDRCQTCIFYHFFVNFFWLKLCHGWMLSSCLRNGVCKFCHHILPWKILIFIMFHQFLPLNRLSQTFDTITVIIWKPNVRKLNYHCKGYPISIIRITSVEHTILIFSKLSVFFNRLIKAVQPKAFNFCFQVMKL
jgi:hypothetical protein